MVSKAQTQLAILKGCPAGQAVPEVHYRRFILLPLLPLLRSEDGTGNGSVFVT